MAQCSAIEWTDSTWNPVTGCTKISIGCKNCYAERFAERFRGVKGHSFESGFDLTLRPERLAQPEHWKKRRLVFVNSMSDLFHESIPDDYIHRVFDVMERANWHVYQVLTKRSALMRDFVNTRYAGGLAPPHMWLGTSIENPRVLERLRHLQHTQSTVRFLSFEPLLESVGPVNFDGIHWVIVGGESGPGARVMKADWVREIRDQCDAQGVAFFFKQWGGRTPKAGGNTLDGRQWMAYPNTIKVAGTLHRRTMQAAGSPAGESNDLMDVGPWAKEKLECLGKYLRAYTTILSKRNFKGYFYIDAFAGPGIVQVRRSQTEDKSQQWLLDVAKYGAKDDGEKEYMSGSPRVALEVKPAFTDYVFIDQNRQWVNQLKYLKNEYASKLPNSRIVLHEGDCNEYFLELLRKKKGQWDRWRGVVFLDPFGMQVPWNTIVELGKTGSIEVFMNFPVGMAIQRLLKRSGKFTLKERNKLDEYFGTEKWFDLIYQKLPGLFGSNTTKIKKSGDLLVKWYRQRLQEVFRYVSEAREICSTDGRPLYYLIFAGPNSTGERIANDILRQGTRKIQ